MKKKELYKESLGKVLDKSCRIYKDMAGSWVLCWYVKNQGIKYSQFYSIHGKIPESLARIAVTKLSVKKILISGDVDLGKFKSYGELG